MSNVTIAIDADTSAAFAKITALMVQADEATKAAVAARRKIMTEISTATAAISTMMSSFSMAMTLIGGQVDAFYGALIGMTLSTVSMMISIATGLAATGVGIPASVIIMGIALTLNVLTIAKLINDKMHTEGIWNELRRIAQKGIYIHSGKTGVNPIGGMF